jgi:hypothetical protein
MDETFKLILPQDFDARAEVEAEQRGLLDYAMVHFASGQTYSICFFTPSRIAVELTLIREAGEACFAEPGLIVIPVITRNEMEKAVRFLASSGYFSNLLLSEKIS